MSISKYDFREIIVSGVKLKIEDKVKVGGAEVDRVEIGGKVFFLAEKKWERNYAAGKFTKRMDTVVDKYGKVIFTINRQAKDTGVYKLGEYLYAFTKLHTEGVYTYYRVARSKDKCA